jgi:death on curing protein
MTRYLSIVELLKLYRVVMDIAGRTGKVQKLSMIEVNLVRPRARYGPRDLIPGLSRKAAELCCGLIENPAFVSGNICIAHAALETMLVLNGYEIAAPADEQERVMLAVAEGRMNEEGLEQWLNSHLAQHEATAQT